MAGVGTQGENIPNLSDVKKSVTEYHDSGSWDRDIAQADGDGQQYLEKRLGQGVRKPAIVLDIDDTSLTTYGYESTHDFGFDKAEMDQYMLDRKLTAITQTRDLVNFARSKGVGVFFVTGRRDKPGRPEATAANLREQGYPEPTELHLRPADDQAPSVVPYKSSTRAGIEREGYDIVLNIGDQDSDLADGHAERPVKLPNPMYKLP